MSTHPLLILGGGILLAGNPEAVSILFQYKEGATLKVENKKYRIYEIFLLNSVSPFSLSPWVDMEKVATAPKRLPLLGKG